MLRDLAEDATAVGIARRYAGIAATIVIDRTDAGLEDSIHALGVRVLVDETVMADSDGERRFAASLLQRLESGHGA
jgi:LPPG:FO 2-phospho-L-lactate transferase